MTQTNPLGLISPEGANQTQWVDNPFVSEFGPQYQVEKTKKQSKLIKTQPANRAATYK